MLDFFKSDEFMPHGHCFLWKPGILWLHVISDTGIAAAYYGIPLALLYFVRHRKDLPFKNLFVLFAAFIVLCGTTHIMGIWVLWHPDYAMDGVIKALTAVVSISTFFVLLKLLPTALKLVTPENLDMARLALQLQASEAKLRAVVDHTLDGLITIDARGVVSTFNPACERIFGYRAEEVIGQNVKILMPEPYHSQHDGYISKHNETGKAKIIGTAGRELTARRKDGSLFPIDLSISSFRLDDGTHFSGIIRDITERKLAEETVQLYTQALERSNKELDEFAHIASHDMKEPLRGVHSQASFLLEDFGDKLDKPALDRINRIAYLVQRLEQLVNDLLYFSQLGRSDLAVEEADPNAMIEEIRLMLEPILKERNARILVPQPLPRTICDRVRITEVFRNLITNAVKYNDKPEKRVEIGFREWVDTAEGPERNVFFVKDNGIGIEPQHHEEIFRIFRRLNHPALKTDEGTGAGLTFVKKIIERFGGRVWLDSSPDEGTTFFFTLEHRIR
jgi:two-component system, LuxR family, sensor kinase FixL